MYIALCMARTSWYEPARGPAGQLLRWPACALAAITAMALFGGLWILPIVAAVVAGGADAAAVGASCDLTGSWYHIPASAFDHTTAPIWTNQACIFSWVRVRGAASLSTGESNGAALASFRVEAPLSCWLDGAAHSGTIISVRNNSQVLIQVNASVSQTGFIDDTCQRVDIASDSSLYVRVSTHPFFMPHHEWMRVAAAWLLRAAHVTFEDGSRHLTPGYPTNYDGQWMRDGFYGISMLWPVANITHRRDFGTSAAGMYSHARRSDGILPQVQIPCKPLVPIPSARKLSVFVLNCIRQACPPSGDCAYGQSGTPPVAGEYSRTCNNTEHHCQDLDSAGFAVKLAHHIWAHLDSTDAQRDFYTRWAPVLERGLNATTHDPSGSGLLWSNESSPNVG